MNGEEKPKLVTLQEIDEHLEKAVTLLRRIFPAEIVIKIIKEELQEQGINVDIKLK